MWVFLTIILFWQQLWQPSSIECGYKHDSLTESTVEMSRVNAIGTRFESLKYLERRRQSNA